MKLEKICARTPTMLAERETLKEVRTRIFIAAQALAEVRHLCEIGSPPEEW